MRKYGIENFTIEILEEIEDNRSSEREKYWIEQKRSYKNGYNATIGGDGQPYLDYDVLIAAYKKVQNTTLVAQKFNCSPQHLRKILKDNNVDIIGSSEVNLKLLGQPINQLDNNHNYIHTYSSAREAAKILRPNSKSLGGVASHILDVCKGKRNSAYGYKWEYAN